MLYDNHSSYDLINVNNIAHIFSNVNWVSKIVGNNNNYYDIDIIQN